MSSTSAPLRARAARMRQVLGILNKHGLTPGISSRPDDLGDALRTALVEIGPIAVKLGQFLAQRPDLVGRSVAQALESLHSDVPPEPWPVVRRSLEAGLGAPIEQLFASVDPVPVGAGSIAQVHLGRTPNGLDVAIKVRRQGIADQAEVDLGVLRDLASGLAVVSAIPQLDTVELSEELGRQLRAELDFTTEAIELRRFHASLQSRDDVGVPIAIDALTSSSVLTMSRLEGDALSMAMAQGNVILNPRRFVETGVDIYMEMIRNGRFHADPHPGNLIVLPGGRVGILDFGMVGTLSPLTRRHLVKAAQSFSANDSRGVVRACLRLVQVPPGLDREAVESDIRRLMQKFQPIAGVPSDLTTILSETIEVLREHDLVLKSEVAILVRCVIVLEATARALVQDFDLFDAIRAWASDPSHGEWEYVLDAALRQIAEPLRHAMPDEVSELMGLPEETGRVIEQIRSGDLVVNVKLKNLDGAIHHLTSATITAAGLLGSTILLAAQTPPLVLGVSIMGLLGAVLSTAIALTILASMVRHHWAQR